jgi:phosphatidylglycerol:prolipoprotein diacylglycerol transferase
MNLLGPYVHDIDPILGKLTGFYLWWYGLGYTLGFLHLHLFFLRRRSQLGLTHRQVYTLSLLIIFGVLIGGRGIEVAFDEWPFYSEHPWLIPAFWLGGMASHGVLLGAALGAGTFALIYRTPFLRLADELVIPGTVLMGFGRIGNFIDGMIVGGLTDVPWGVKFPYAEGFRHPVVLYDGLKNFLIFPFLLWVRKTNPTPGATAARFIFWYAFLRIFIDLFRDYPTHRLVLGTGQTLNILMTILGMFLLIRSRKRRLRMQQEEQAQAPMLQMIEDQKPFLVQRLAFLILLLFCLTFPSNWTQNVVDRYGERHPGIEYSWLYPDIDTAPP